MTVMFGICIAFDYPHNLLIIPAMIIIFIIDRELDGRYGVLIPSEPRQNKEGVQAGHGDTD
jgi:hypothetical protein